MSSDSAQLALDTVFQKPTRGIPSWMIHVMEHGALDHFAGAPAGSYVKDPQATYLRFQKAIGTCIIDQFIPENPLTMEAHGYVGKEKGATTGAERVVVDGRVIDSPEGVPLHMEEVVFPAIQRRIREFDEEKRVLEILEQESKIQETLGSTMLKTGYAFASFPYFSYGMYGYVNYFSAYALFPDVMERHFSLQADLAVLNNRAAARAYREGNLPPLYRLDHDMADSSKTLVDIKSLDRIWLPHFTRSIEPLVRAGVKLLWHCDGNLMAMVPRLIEAGVRGFQGFQYEDGMDYEKICSMKSRDGEDLVIIAGVSVTRTLPFGKPSDVSREMRWLVEKGPRTGLFLGGSSSVAPGVPFGNLAAMFEGLAHYRVHGREGI